MSKSEIRNQKSEIDAEAAAIAAAKAALEPLARIDPRGDRQAVNKEKDGDAPQFTGQYRISRGRRQTVITADEIAAAVKCRDGEASLADCLKALKPLARLPVDPGAASDTATVYRFDGADGEPVAISNKMIESAQGLIEG